MSLLDCNSETQEPSFWNEEGSGKMACSAQNVCLGSQRAHAVSDIFVGLLVPVQGLATSRCQQR